jgi:hypothetical protein
LAAASYVELEANVQTDAAGGIFFDRYADDRFKFVVLDAVADQVLVGHQEPRKGWVVDVAIDHTLNSGEDYDVKLTLKGSSVSVMVDGQMVTSHGYNAPIVDGDIGLVTRGGESTFDSFNLGTNDPAFEAPVAAAAAMIVQDDGPSDPLDVNNDGHVTPLDALLVINELSQGGVASVVQSTRLDVSGDNSVSPLDALLVINELNARYLAVEDNATDVGSELGVARRKAFVDTDQVLFERLNVDQDLESILSEIAVIEEEDEEAVDQLFGDSEWSL